MKFETVGVVGAGVMGAGLAQALAQRGCTVVLVDVTDDALDGARASIRQTLRFATMFDSTGNSDPNGGGKAAGGNASDGEALPVTDPDAVLDRIEGTTDYDALAPVDFVVENATEKWDVKKEIYPVLDAVCAEDVVIGANTSCISITRLGGVTSRPEQVVGMHFMNPVPAKPTVEMIRGHHTTDATIDTAQAFLAQLDKSGVVVEDMPGFVTNRVLMLTVNEAIFTLQDGVAEPKDIDRLFRECFGHQMGPLKTADLIGLDTILYSLEVLQESYQDPKFRPAPLLKRKVHAGEMGRKSGRGFYRYA